MRRVEASFRVVTPMFLGDASQNASSLRPPSIKGALRFWWRSMQWAGSLRQAHGDPAGGLRRLHAREAELFGAASGVRGARQSLFFLDACLDAGSVSKQPPAPMSGHAYLLGQGLFHFSQGYQRKAIAAGGKFSVNVIFRPQASRDQRREIAEALFLWGCLGGLGCRARKGLGSVSVTSIEGADLAIPESPADLSATLKRMLGDLPAELPPFTAFSSRSRIDCSKVDPDAWDLLDAVGVEMMMYRSWGRGGKVDGQRRDPTFPRPAERNFPQDYKSASSAAGGTCPASLPKRVVFGLPHNYYFSSTRVPVSVEPAHKKRARRASPLLTHIHRFPDRTHAAVQSLMPATFLPPGDRVKMGSRTLRTRCELPANPDWSVLHEYLDRFQTRKGLLH